MTSTKKQTQNLPNIDSESEDERVSAILIPDQPFEAEENEYVELPEVSTEMLTRYQNFLLDKLHSGLRMTGREDAGYFAWEERFSFIDNETEHKRLNQELASYEDQFEFICFCEAEEFGLMAKVKRMNDQKIFVIPLADLVVCDEKIKQHQLVEDYSYWFVNFGPFI